MNNKVWIKKDDSNLNLSYTKNLFHNNRTNMGSGSWVSNVICSFNFANSLFLANVQCFKSQSKDGIQEKNV